MRVHYFFSSIVLITLILPTVFFGDLTHQNQDRPFIQEENIGLLSDNSPLAASTMVGQQYQFTGGGGDYLYTNPDNWATTGVYSGYPGTDVPSGDHIESLVPISVPNGITLNLACSLKTGFINNSGTIYLNPNSNGGDNEINELNNLSGGQIFINRFLNIGSFDNRGNLFIEEDGLIVLSGTCYNFNQIEVKQGGQINGGDISNNSGVISNSGIINTAIFRGTIENSGFISFTNEGAVLGTGKIQQVTNPSIIRPGGQDMVGTMTIGSLDLVSFSVIEMEVDGSVTSGDYDQIIIESPFLLLGDIEINRLVDFQPTACEEYPLLQWQGGPLLVNMASVEVSNFGNHDWRRSFNDNSYVFHLMPGEAANNALDFDADSSLIHIGHNLGTIRTIEFKFFPNVVDPNTSGDNIINYYSESFKFIWTMSNTSALTGETLTVLNGDRLWTNFDFQQQWYHVAIVSNDGSRYNKIYIDGVDINASQQGTGASLFVLDDFNIGGRDPALGNSTGFFDGRMDEFRFWSDTRTEEEIQGNWYKALDSDDTQGLMAYYKFDHGLAYQDNNCNPLLVDYSGNHNHGQLHNFDLNEGRSNWVRAQVCPFYVSTEFNTFMGNANHALWSEPNNWSQGRVPGSCDNVFIPFVPDAFEVVVDVPFAVCNTIEVRGGINIESVFQFQVFAPGE